MIRFLFVTPYQSHESWQKSSPLSVFLCRWLILVGISCDFSGKKKYFSRVGKTEASWKTRNHLLRVSESLSNLLLTLHKSETIFSQRCAYLMRCIFSRGVGVGLLAGRCVKCNWGQSRASGKAAVMARQWVALEGALLKPWGSCVMCFQAKGHCSCALSPERTRPIIHAQS